MSVATAQSHRFNPHCFQPVSSTFYTGASATAFRASWYAGSSGAAASRSKFEIVPSAIGTPKIDSMISSMPRLLILASLHNFNVWNG